MARICGTEAVWDETFEGPNGPIADGHHVVPRFEFDPLHLAHRSCWCKPELTDFGEDGLPIWSHRIVN